MYMNVVIIGHTHGMNENHNITTLSLSVIQKNSN